MESLQFKYLSEIPEIGPKIINYTTSNLTAPGENFWSAMFKLELEVSCRDGETKVVHTVAKCLPAFTKPFQRDMAVHAIKNEVDIYNVVIPLFKEFQRENGIPEADFFTKVHLAKAVEETGTSRESSIILENLVFEGFETEDRYKGFDLATAKAILRRLAIFHATFIGLKLQKPDVFASKVKLYTQKPPGPPPPGPGGSNEMPEMPNLMEKEAFREVILGNDEISKHMKQLTEIGKLHPFDDKNSVIQEPWATFVHNDFWVNNIMIKHVKGQESQVKFVDFQMCDYKLFVDDLIFFIFTSVQNDVQLESHEELLRYYLNHFNQTLKDLKTGVTLDPHQYMDLIKSQGKAALNKSLFFSNVIFGKKGGDRDMMNDENFDHMEHFADATLSERQKNKVINIIKLAEIVNII